MQIVKSPGIQTVVEHSNSKTAWYVKGITMGKKHHIARVSYVVVQDNVQLSNREKEEAYQHATFISHCFNKAALGDCHILKKVAILQSADNQELSLLAAQVGDKEEDSMESLALSHGFESEAEMYRLISSADITTAVKLSRFTQWQLEDGTKEGLLKL